MVTVVPLTLRQNNDEVIDIVITPGTVGDDLSVVTSLIVVIKPDACTADTATTAVTLSSADPTEILIMSQTSLQITAAVYVPASALLAPYGRWWRCDAYVGSARRTAMYGPVTLIDL